MTRSRFASACAVCAVLATCAFGQGYLCAEGGGNTNKGEWAREVFGWMVEHSQRGPVVILGAYPLADDERIELFKSLGCDQVRSLAITRENANDDDIVDSVRRSRLVFLRGGDQWNYVSAWSGTRTRDAIREVFDKGGVVAGTSAGCAVLGEFVFDAHHGSLTSQEALTDASHENITLTHDFLGFAPGVLFDTHFSERARLARAVVMAAVAEHDFHPPVTAIGCDPRTALCVSPDGSARVMGEGCVTLIMPSVGTSDVVESGREPLVSPRLLHRLPAGAVLELRDRHVRVVSTGRPGEGDAPHREATLPGVPESSVMIWGLDSGPERLEECLGEFAQAADHATYSLTLAALPELHRHCYSKLTLTKLSDTQAWHAANGRAAFFNAHVAVVPDDAGLSR